MESCFTSGATNDMSSILKLPIILMERLNPFLCFTSLSPVLPSISFRLLLLRTCPSTLRWLSRRPSRLDAWQQHLAMFSVCKPVSPARNTLGRESLPPLRSKTFNVFFGRFSGRARVRILNTILAKVDIFGNAKKVGAEIMISNFEGSIVCVRISNRILRKIGVFRCFL